MSRLRWMVLALVLSIALAVPAHGSDKEKAETRKCQAIASLLLAIESDNAGLRESAAFVLGEIKCTKAVIPLMRILHDQDKPESSRIVAALALSRIGDARGVYAVKRNVIFDDSQKVRNVCAWFYNEYVSPGTYAFIYAEHPTDIAQTQVLSMD